MIKKCTKCGSPICIVDNVRGICANCQLKEVKRQFNIYKKNVQNELNKEANNG